MEKKPSGNTARKQKLLFALDMPYTAVKWYTRNDTLSFGVRRLNWTTRPTLSEPDGVVVMELLSRAFDPSLLSPIGDHRSKYTNRSKGKRAKKRKRDEAHKEQNLEPNPSPARHESGEVGTPPDLEILNYLTIGFNTTNRYLEALAQKSTQGTFQPATQGLDIQLRKPHEARKVDLQASSLKPLEAVFVPRSDQPSIMHSHLPVLIKAASLASSPPGNIKLVVLPKGAKSKLSTALGIPRAGIIGLVRGAPATTPLLEFIKKRVPEVEIPWLSEREAGVYLPVNINVTHTTGPIITKRVNGTQDSQQRHNTGDSSSQNREQWTSLK